MKKVYVLPTIQCIEFSNRATLLAGSGRVTTDLMDFGTDAEVTDEASARSIGFCEDDNLTDFLQE